MSLFLLAMIFWTDRAKAAEAETELVVHTVSYHFDRSQEWNERNFGLGLRHDHGDGYSSQIGTYPNSYNRRTWYLIGQKEWPVMSFHAGVFAGAVTGYDYPVAAGLMASTNNLTIRFVPPVGAHTTGVLALEFRKGF